MKSYFSTLTVRNTKKSFLWFILLANIICIFSIWWTKSNYYIQNPDGGNIFIALGRITGLLGEYFLLVELVLVGRLRFIEGVFGFDRLNKFHRWVGYSILSLLVSHPILLIFGYSKANGVPLMSQFADFLANWENVLLAYIALMLIIFIVIISVVIIRKKLKYETWYFTHLFMYVAIGLAFSHQIETGDLSGGGWVLSYWYIINFTVFGLVLLYRFIRPLFLFARHRFYVEYLVQETDDTWSIYITGEKMDKFKFEPGQYANLNILSRGLWYTHPFSFSSDFNGDSIRFSIKSLGDYTSKIPNIKAGTKVIIDGPFGLFISKLAKREKYLFIAGGIGITPLRGMIESLSKKSEDICLLFATKTEKDIIFKKELDIFSEQNRKLKIHYITSEETPGLEYGRIDKDKIVRLVPDFYSREVFLCGPNRMMESVVQNLKEIGFSQNNLHYEKFSF